MSNAIDFEFDDLQALLRFGHGRLIESCFLLLNVVDAGAAKAWLAAAPVSSAVIAERPPETALQVAFSAQGLRALGVKESLIEGFSDEFITGMAADKSRCRRLGDTGGNAPEHWEWGGATESVPHVLLLLYAQKEGLERWRKTVEDEQFSQAFHVLKVLPTHELRATEPFGFVDGVSQPKIDWAGRQSTDLHARAGYSNLLAVGEVVLGYRNEYGLYSARPLLDPKEDPAASELPNAEDQPVLKDLGRNGSYLVLRQLHQDVPGFWQFLDQETGSVPEEREQLAAAMVGRERDGAPLAPLAGEEIPGIAWKDRDNHFTYASDRRGRRCPISAHIRRVNPRTGDYPAGITGWFRRLLASFGFGPNRWDEDLIASTRFHRLLRRGRGYGPLLTPEEAVKPDAPAAERGLHFITLVGNISRQFEFVQNAWAMSSTFGGVHQERDPLLGVREPLADGTATDRFNRPDPAGPTVKTCHLPQFVTVRGGGYFFMPGLRALRYIALAANTKSEATP